MAVSIDLYTGMGKMRAVVDRLLTECSLYQKGHGGIGRLLRRLCAEWAPKENRTWPDSRHVDAVQSPFCFTITITN